MMLPFDKDESFNSKKEAQEYADKQIEKEYGLLPKDKSFYSKKEAQEYADKQIEKEYGLLPQTGMNNERT